MNEIDLVIPMVFPADPEWQREYAAATGRPEATANVRYRSWGTEELLIRCCNRYMPWLHRIHILLASESQVQPWMERYSKLHIVFHRDFIPAHLLPTFNVNTIEMFLHNIPFLLEHFIYSNDDFFPLSPLESTDFFRDGLPCQHHDEEPYPSAPNIFCRFVKSGLDMVAADWGRQFPTTWLRGGHSMQPMLLSTVQEVCCRHADRISQSFTVKRTDRNFNQYIFPFWQHLSGRYVDHVPRRQLIEWGTPIESLPRIIQDPEAGIVCFNDNDAVTDWLRRAEIIRNEITLKLK